MTNRDQLVTRLAAELGSTKVDANAILKIVANVLADHLAENKQAVLPGFGRLKTVSYPSRQGRNPKTGESITVAAKEVIKFKQFPAGSKEAKDQE